MICWKRNSAENNLLKEFNFLAPKHFEPVRPWMVNWGFCTLLSLAAAESDWESLTPVSVINASINSSQHHRLARFHNIRCGNQAKKRVHHLNDDFAPMINIPTEMSDSFFLYNISVSIQLGLSLMYSEAISFPKRISSHWDISDPEYELRFGERLPQGLPRRHCLPSENCPITVLIFDLILTPLFSLWPNQAAKSDSLADTRLCQSDHTCIGRLYFQGYFWISVAMQVDTWGFEKGRHEGAQITHAGYCSSTHGGRHHKKITFIYFMKKKKIIHAYIHTLFAFLW